MLPLVLFLRELDNVPRFTGLYWEYFANCLEHSFADLEVPYKAHIERLPYDKSHEKERIEINYFFIMDNVHGIAALTKGKFDKSNTREIIT